jgi:formylglycine-generating enzyme required for sulfatase activity
LDAICHLFDPVNGLSSAEAPVPIAVLRHVEPHPLARGIPPEWASGWGQDEIAPWASITIGEVSQRLRWIPPGRFLMGAAEDEDGRFGDEVPQHEVTIERGFWMFATPCTQALWEAVMGQNRSHFPGPTRPVENVSWKDCQEFVVRLNGLLEGPELSLPSEAQWEYACRAGSERAPYDKLPESAWYGDNSGDQTQPVGLRRANAWGLYDMLGNVWEWCADEYRPYGSGDPGASAVRVLRGGSWDSSARDVRAAIRGWNGPGYRNGFIGFRCAEFREGVEGLKAEP